MSFNEVKELISNKKIKAKTERRILLQYIETSKCNICHDILSIPMMITPCGHTYCYECLLTWFKNNENRELNCPDCRVSIEVEPCFNFFLHLNLKFLIESIYKKRKKEPKVSELLRGREQDYIKYHKDKNANNMFDSIFKNSAVAINDVDDDGIPRCSNCHWELDPDDMDEDENICPHCHSRIRNIIINERGASTRDRLFGNRPENEDEYSEGEYDEIVDEVRPEDSDTGDDSNDEEKREEEEGEYDSDLDSFIENDEIFENSEELADDKVESVFYEVDDEEEHDSDFYEHNDEGFVSGDSLNEERENELEQEPIEVEIEEEEEDDDDDESQYNKSRKRNKIQVILSDDE